MWMTDERHPSRGKGPKRVGLLGACLWTLTLLCTPAHAQAAGRDPSLPQRNMLIEWRMNGMSQGQRRQQGIQTGQILIDAKGQVIGRSSIGLSTVQTESQAESVQQVQVINGGKARLFVGRSQPYTVWQWAWTPAAIASNGRVGLGVIGPQQGSQGSAGQAVGSATPSAPAQPNGYPTPQLVAQTTWIDLGQGLYVRPRWPGGREPVLVELEAQARQPMQAGDVYSGQMEPDGQTRRIEVGSTLSVPLGQWAVVARSGSRDQRDQSGTLSTRDLDQTESQQLEIRITAP